MKKQSIIILILILCVFPYEAKGQDLKKVDSLLKYKPELKKPAPVQNNFSLSTLYTTNYIWRDAITDYAAIQPSATYSFGNSGFSVNFWSSYGVHYKTNDLEISTTFSYGFSVTEGLSANVGFVHYVAPILSSGSGFNMDTNFSEYFFGISLSQASLSVFMKNNGGIYSNLSFSRSIAIHDKLSLTLNSSLGYRTNDPSDAGGFRDLNFTVSLPLKLKYINFGLFSSVTRVVEAKVTAYQVGINFQFQ